MPVAALLLGALLPAAMLLPAKAGPLGQHDPLAATTSREARQSALESIPLDKLDPQALAKVRTVLSNVTVFRRLPVQVVDCDPDLYLFLVRHPDVVVGVWQALKLSRLELRQAGPNSFEIAEPDGSTAWFEYLYRSHDTHIAYAEGTYAGALLARPVKGRCLLILRTGYVRETNGRYYITNRLDTFVSVDRSAAQLVTRTIQPVIGRVADNNFIQTVGFLGSLSRTAETNSEGVKRLAASLKNVAPETRREFAEVAGAVALKVEATRAETAARARWAGLARTVGEARPAACGQPPGSVRSPASSRRPGSLARVAETPRTVPQR